MAKLTTPREPMPDDEEKLRIPTSTLVIVIIVVAIILTPVSFYLGNRADTATQDKVASERDKTRAEKKAILGQSLADQVLSACVHKDKIGSELIARGLCTRALTVQVESSPAQATQSMTINPAELDDAIQHYFLHNHPPRGRDASPAMVAAAVAEYLSHHSSQGGHEPTQAEISASVSRYLTSHSDQFRGEPGQPGMDANADQITAAVITYCASHNHCVGPQGIEGQTGPSGTSFTDLIFARDETGQCFGIAIIQNPNNGSQSTIRHAAGDAACPTEQPSIPLGN